MLQTGEINFPNAHQAEIRAIEHTNYQNMEFVFSAGLDNKLKVWTLDRTQNIFVPAEEKDLGSPVHCLQMLPDNILVAGLENGSLSIWNLNNNSLNSMPAHQCAISSLMRHDNYLVSGDV